MLVSFPDSVTKPEVFPCLSLLAPPPPPPPQATRPRIAQFIAQEVIKDKKIPHFTSAAVLLIVEEARRRGNRKEHLTLRFRE